MREALRLYRCLLAKVRARIARSGIHENEGQKEVDVYAEYVEALQVSHKLSYGEAAQIVAKFFDEMVNLT